MSIKEIPTNFRVYYKRMIGAYTQRKEEAITLLEDLTKELDGLYIDVKSEFNLKGDEYGINLNDYKEFINNEYSTGELFRVAKGYFINKQGNYEIIGSRYTLFRYARTQKEIYTLRQDIVFCDKMLSLKLYDYNDILKTYFNKVHEKMIIDGYGYAIGGRIGWTCINRCHVKERPNYLDYKATKEKKKQLLDEGKHIYNKEEEEWCKANGIEYEYEDYKVFQNIEYCYEIPLLGSTLPNGKKLKLTTPNYYSRSVRGKSQEQLIQECNNDKHKICNLDLDIRAKLDLCLLVDKMLYTKFIRNENQESCNFAKANRKSR